MLENTTVTLPLNDFDNLRVGEREYRDITRHLAHCFDYTCTKNPYPQECESCESTDNKHSYPNNEGTTIFVDCANCAAFLNHKMYNELLTVDVERLIEIAKIYALYGKDVETDIDAIPIERKAERVDA